MSLHAATDPAVQAAQTYLHNIFCGTPSCALDCLEDARSVVAAVTPLIRAQAFTEAADRIDKLVSPQLFGIDREQQRIRDGAFNDAIHAAFRAVRGLGEESRRPNGGESDG